MKGYYAQGDCQLEKKWLLIRLQKLDLIVLIQLNYL